jgi:hypothetical protein
MKTPALIFSALLTAATAGAATAPADPQDARQELREVLRQTPSLARGAELYRNCVACHGTDGNGLPQGDVPAIAQQHQRVIAKQLIDYRHAERWDPLMEEVVARHGLSSAQDIADVAAYVAALHRDAGRAGLGDGRQVETGSRLYTRDCAGCHGADGEGNGVTLVPRLAGQHYKYVLRQLHDTLEQRRPNMPPPHPQLFDPLQVDQLTGLADYLARLQPPRRVLPP